MYKIRQLSRFVVMTFLIGSALGTVQGTAGVLDQYGASYINLMSENIYSQFNSAARQFERGTHKNPAEFITCQATLDAAFTKYNTQKKDDAEWFAKASFLHAKAKVAIKSTTYSEAHNVKVAKAVTDDEIRKAFQKAYDHYVKAEADPDVKDRLAEVIHDYTVFLDSLDKPTAKDKAFIAKLPENMKLAMSDVWNVKLGLIQAALDKTPQKARDTLLSIVERMPARTSDQAHVFARIAEIYYDDRELDKASENFRKAHAIYARNSDQSHAGRIAYALQKFEGHRGDYPKVVEYAKQAMTWIKANETRAAAAKKEAEAKATVADAGGASAENKAPAGSVAVYPPRSANNDDDDLPVLVAAVDSDISEQYKVEEVVPVMLNLGEALYGLGQFADAKGVFQTARSLANAQSKEVAPANLSESVRVGAPRQQLTAAQKRKVYPLETYKVVASVGVARAEAHLNANVDTAVDTAKDSLTQAKASLVVFGDDGKKFSDFHPLSPMIEATYWQLALQQLENANGGAAAYKAKRVSLERDHGLSKDMLKSAVAKNSGHLMSSRALWRVYYVQAMMAIKSEDWDKAMEFADIGRETAALKGFKLYEAKSYQQIALIKDALRTTKKAEIAALEKGLADASDKPAHQALIAAANKEATDLKTEREKAKDEALKCQTACGLVSNGWMGTAVAETHV